MNVFAVLFACLAVTSASTNYLERKISRIIYGDEASPGEFPHQVTLLRNGYHMCGGSIIANGWVLTAAHCVDGQSMSSLAIVSDLHDFNNPGNYIWHDIAEIRMHNNFNQGAGAFPNDVAVLRLVANGNDISRNAIPVASGSNDFAGTTCVISGWGVTEHGTGSSVLLKADVLTLSRDECVYHWSNNNILDQHICVMGTSTPNGAGACNGDSGGPLVCNGLLAGVTSWGRSGCHSDGIVTHPSVYARVSFFYNWIRSNCNNCV